MDRKTELMTEREAAEFLSVTLSCLRKWRARRVGPRHFKLERMIRYRLSDVVEWLDEHRSDDHHLGGAA